MKGQVLHLLRVQLKVPGDSSDLSVLLTKRSLRAFQNLPYHSSSVYSFKIQELFIYLHQIKTQKLQNLLGPQITNSQPRENNNTVITIPADLQLSDPEKSVLSKGLNFAPIAKRTDEFAVKQDGM